MSCLIAAGDSAKAKYTPQSAANITMQARIVRGAGSPPATKPSFRPDSPAGAEKLGTIISDQWCHAGVTLCHSNISSKVGGVFSDIVRQRESAAARDRDVTWRDDVRPAGV